MTHTHTHTHTHSGSGRTSVASRQLTQATCHVTGALHNFHDTQLILFISSNLLSHLISFHNKHTPTQHPLHQGLIQSWRPPSSTTRRNQYHTARVSGRTRQCSDTAAAASRRHKVHSRKTRHLQNRKEDQASAKKHYAQQRADSAQSGAATWWTALSTRPSCRWVETKPEIHNVSAARWLTDPEVTSFDESGQPLDVFIGVNWRQMWHVTSTLALSRRPRHTINHHQVTHGAT